jgi:hypothetical protein
MIWFVSFRGSANAWRNDRERTIAEKRVKLTPDRWTDSSVSAASVTPSQLKREADGVLEDSEEALKELLRGKLREGRWCENGLGEHFGSVKRKAEERQHSRISCSSSPIPSFSEESCTRRLTV